MSIILNVKKYEELLLRSSYGLICRNDFKKLSGEFIDEYKKIKKKYRFKLIYIDIHYGFLMGSVYLIPIIKVLKRKKYSESDIGDILAVLTDTFVGNIPKVVISFFDKSMNSFLGKIGVLIFQYNPLSYLNKYRFKFLYRKEEGYILGFDYIKCGICTLYKEELISEYVKYLCCLDFNMFDKIGFKLSKNKLLSDNKEICNFRLVKKV